MTYPKPGWDCPVLNLTYPRLLILNVTHGCLAIVSCVLHAWCLRTACPRCLLMQIVALAVVGLGVPGRGICITSWARPTSSMMQLTSRCYLVRFSKQHKTCTMFKSTRQGSPDFPKSWFMYWWVPPQRYNPLLHEGPKGSRAPRLGPCQATKSAPPDPSRCCHRPT